MEKHSRTLTALMLALFALLLGGGLLLGGCQPEHLSYCVAFALSIPLVALFVRWQKRRRAASLWERLGAGKTAALLLGVCFALNLAWVLFFRLEPNGDFEVYWRCANSLAGTGPEADWHYIALFPHILGYSAFLSVFLRLFGGSALAAPVLNVCLTTLSGWFLFRLCLRWRGLNQAAFALLLWSLMPSKLFYNALVLPEPFYTCLLLAVLFLIAETEGRRPRPGPAAALGLAAGLLLRLVQAVRPIAPVAVIALLIWLVCLRRERTAESRKTWLCFTALLLCAYFAAAPLWNAAAARMMGEKPASSYGYSFYVGMNPDSLGGYSRTDMERLNRALDENGDQDAEMVQRQMLEAARERLTSGQAPLGRLFVAKLQSFLGFDEGGAFYSRAGLRDRAYMLLALVSNVFYYALGILALVGAWFVYHRAEQRTLLLAPLYVIGLTLAQMLVEVAPRFHYSVHPMLIILAACACFSPEERESL